MEITVKIDKEEAILAAREFWTKAKKQLEPVVVAAAFALGAAWVVTGVVAMAKWMSYSGESEVGWIVVWITVTGAWVGYFFYRDDS